MSTTIYHVELVNGAQNTTPWGKRDKKGVKFPCQNLEHLAYYTASGRYKVTSRVVAPAPATAKTVNMVGKQGRSGPTKVLITTDRLLALARVAVRVNMDKKRLLALAADLGVEGIDSRLPPSNAQLVKKIAERQAVLLAELEPSEGVAGEGVPAE